MTRYQAILAEFLKRRGLRMTKPREAILARVLSAQGHFRAEELARDIAAAGGASRASVYRTLNLMAEAGLLKKSVVGEGYARYERAFGHPDHDHMVCVRCERIIEFRDSSIEKKVQAIAEKAGFAVHGRRLQITGLCARCQKGG